MSESDTPKDNLNQVINLVNTIGIEIAGTDRRQDRCRYINGNVLVKVVNQLGIPGLVYTLQVDRHDPKTRFNETWLHHSVGILKTGEGYLAFDQTNTQEEGGNNFFFANGSLENISQQLDNRFGSNWDLDFEPENDEQREKLSIAGKMEMVQDSIKKGVKFAFDDVTPEAYDGKGHAPLIEDRKLHKRLGIKFLLPGALDKTQSNWSKLRSHFTFGYA